MREDADTAQEIINRAFPRLKGIDDLETQAEETSNFEGQRKVISFELDDLDLQIVQEDEQKQDLHQRVSPQALNEIYSAVRNNSGRVNPGYNEIEALMAVENQISPQMVTGAAEKTIDEWYNRFREAGITYPEQETEKLTTEGLYFLESSRKALNRMGRDWANKEDRETLGEIFTDLSPRNSTQGNKVYSFIMMADTNFSIEEISDQVDVSRRTAYNWAEEWFEAEKGFKMFKGSKSDRELTENGKIVYDTVKQQYKKIEMCSEFKAELIDQLEEHDAQEQVPYIPGNRDLVSEFTDADVNKYMETPQ
jgi:transposase